MGAELGAARPRGAWPLSGRGAWPPIRWLMNLPKIVRIGNMSLGEFPP